MSAARRTGDVPLSVTVLGGGNGASTVLRGLAAAVRSGERRLRIRAVVATADDGGSSGRLRRQLGGLPPGDIRNCLLSLVRDPGRPFAEVFAHRYGGSGELAGHALGNLILAAATERYGCFRRAIEVTGELLGTCGEVLPVSLEPLHLSGLTEDGENLVGESTVGGTASRIRKVWLEPQDVTPGPGVLEAIAEAQLLIIGPGSLYTSLLAVLQVPGVVDAIRRCRGERVLVANLMTQPGETVGMDLGDHMSALDFHIGSGLVGTVLLHRWRDVPDRVLPYHHSGAHPVETAGTEDRAERFVFEDLITSTGKIRHEPGRLAQALLGQVRQARRTAPAAALRLKPHRAGVKAAEATAE